MVPFSVLDLSPIIQGGSAAQAFRNSLDLAQHAETLGLSTATGWPSITTCRASPARRPRWSSAMSPAAPRTIRVGAGGVMLPNHSPLVDRRTVRHARVAVSGPHRPRARPRAGHRRPDDAGAAPRRSAADENAFPRDVMELQAYFEPVQPGQAIRAVPGRRAEGADLAARIQPVQRAAGGGAGAAVRLRLALRARLPAAGARRLPADVPAVGGARRARMRWSASASSPPTPTPRRRRLFTSAQHQFVNLRRGTPGPLQPPVDSMDGYWSPAEKAGVEHALAYAAVGSAETGRPPAAGDSSTPPSADELMITGQIYDHAARLRSFEIAASFRDSEFVTTN